MLSAIGAELLGVDFPAKLRFHVVAPQAVRRQNGPEGCHLRELEAERRKVRKRRFGLGASRPTDFDLVLNAGSLGMSDMADLVEATVRSHGLLDAGFLSGDAAAKIQARARARLARLGVGAILPDQPELGLGRQFGHPSEQIFANLLDFYGIAWDYEPRSFPLQWDKDGKVSEAFTPDFYLPEFDLYVELTTMKQAHVTRKNRKIRLLKAIYPHVNIQVFYQKDVQDLVMKYDLPERLSR